MTNDTSRERAVAALRDFLNSEGIIGPNIRHVEWTEGLHMPEPWPGPGWCVCNRVWPCAALAFERDMLPLLVGSDHLREAARTVVDAVARWHLPTTVGGPRLSDALISLRAALATQPDAGSVPPSEQFFTREDIRRFREQAAERERERADKVSTMAGRDLLLASRTVVTGRDRSIITIAEGDVLDAILAIEAELQPDAGSVATREGLDEAWKAAEAALPEGWVMWTLGPGAWSARADQPGHVIRNITGWEAEALGPNDQRKGYGPTPAAALLALADRLTGATE